MTLRARNHKSLWNIIVFLSDDYVKMKTLQQYLMNMPFNVLALMLAAEGYVLFCLTGYKVLSAYRNNDIRGFLMGIPPNIVPLATDENIKYAKKLAC